jgi:peptide methionine sulfoxide reductase msrA/msrB
MQFITNIFMLITSFFGWGATEPTPQPVESAMVQPAGEETPITSQAETSNQEQTEQTITSQGQAEVTTTAVASASAPAPVNKKNMWLNYQKPSKSELKATLNPVTFKVTQKNGTETPNSSALDKNWAPGIYVDVLSGEPLYSSKDKFDSGTGWPSFVRPIKAGAVTEHEDNFLFTKRTEIRSAIADNHIGHVFTDGPEDSTGLRYCMNGVALRFVPQSQMVTEGYEDYLQYI